MNHGLFRAWLTCSFLLPVLAVAGEQPAADDAAKLDPKNPPEGVFTSEWVEIYFGPGKIGSGQSKMRREGKVIHTTNDMVMRMGRADQPVEIQLYAETAETLDGAPLAFRSDLKMSENTIRNVGEVKDGKVHLETHQFGMVTKDTFDFPQDALMTWGTYREQLLRGFKPGLKYTLKVYDPQTMTNGALETDIEVHDWETYTHRDKKFRALRVDMAMQMPAGTLTMKSWVDKNGQVMRAEMPVPGLGNLRIFTVDQETALRDFVPPEIFMTNIVRVPKIDTAKARAVKFRVKLEGEDEEKLTLPNTGMQQVKPIDEKTAEVIVHRQAHTPVESGDDAGKPTGPDLAQYLEGNMMMNLDDPELVALAHKAAGDAGEPFALADNLRRFVRDHIADKNMSVGFATANEVCRSREGDCSEHGVLLAALGRVNKLPSRVVIGIAYAPVFGGQENIMGYHLWTQFLINGQWYDFDAALGDEVAPNPARVALAVSSLKDAGMADLSLPLIGKIGRLQVKVLEVK